MTFCALCGKPSEHTHHLIFGYGIRKIADQDGITMDLCSGCHNIGKYRIHDNPVSEALSKMLGQSIWEQEKMVEGMTKEEARDSFIRRYGQSYLWWDEKGDF